MSHSRALHLAFRASLLLASCTFVGLPAAAQTAPPPTVVGCDLVPVADAETVTIATSLGTFQIELFSNVAPLTVANFLGYIDRGDYDGVVIHRVVPDFVMQTGGYRFENGDVEVLEKQDPVDNEPCISNVAGTIAMAKSANDPDSATSEWFVNLADNSANLDSQNGGFTAFGQLVGDDLDVVDAILAGSEAIPTEPIPPYLAAVQFASWEIFQGMQLDTPLDLNADYGCFDPAQSGVVLAEDPTGSGDWEPNQAFDLPFTLASTACETGGGPNLPAFPCQDPGRRILLLDPDTGEFFPDPAAEFGLAEATLSCDGLEASEASYALRLAGFPEQIDDTLIRPIYVVPEPSAAASLAAGVALLLALRRMSRSRPSRVDER